MLPMRILHILDHSLPLQSGYTFRTLAILRQQHLLGWETCQLTGPKQGRDGTDRQQVDGWEFFRTPRQRMAGWPLLAHLGLVQCLSERIDQVARATRPDLLHAHSPALNGLAALHAGRRLGLPVVYEVRAFWEDAAADLGSGRNGGLRYGLSRALETYVARHADAVTTICDGLRDDLCLRGIPQEQVSVIPNAVDTAQFHPGLPADSQLKQALGLGSGPVIGFIGSFYAYEGLALLLTALPAMLRVQPGLRVLLVGGGPHEAVLRALARTLKLADNVIFTGRVAHDMVASHYALLDLLVYPRLPMRLTELVTPLKPLEAMAQGCLVLASDVGGHRELIGTCPAARLFQAGNPAALADAVLAMLAQPQAWPALKLAARRFVESKRSWPASVARYGSVYAAAMASHHAP